jgi:hypothetical protein
MSIGQYDINNTILGEDAMENALIPGASIGSDNTAYGCNALKNLTDHINENSAFGSQALVSAIDGENSAFGAYAGAQIENGTKNALFGNWAGRFVSGDYNTACGYRALAGDMATDNIPGSSFATGGSNTAVGAGAMRYYPNGGENVAVGYSALNQITDGNNNTAIGSGAGRSIKTGNNNTFIGKGANASDGNAQQRTAIGAGAQADADNTIILGTSENVGIGTTNPDSRLHVQIGPAQTQSRPAIHAKGVPGILAEGSVPTAHAIRAIGSSRAPAIYVEGGTGTGVPSPGAPAIYAKGSDTYPAIYAEATGTGASAIYAQGSSLAPPLVPAIYASGTDEMVGLFAEGSPGIRAQKIGASNDHPAIHAIGSGQGNAIKAGTSGSVAAIYAEGNGVHAIEAVRSGSVPPTLTPVIHAEATGSGPAVYAENVSGPAIQADGTIKAFGPGSAPAIRATGSSGRAIEAQSSSSSVAAIYAKGSPAIDAVGSTSSPAIHAVGSSGAPGIRVEASASASIANINNAAAIYTQGSVANAIYASTTGSAPAIHAKGATYSSSLTTPGAALFVDGGFRAKVRYVNLVLGGTYSIQSDDYTVIFYGSITGNMIVNLPQANVQDGQMFIIRNYSGSNNFQISTQGSTYGIARPRGTFPVSPPTTWEITDTGTTGYHGGVILVFYQGIYYVLLYTY